MSRAESFCLYLVVGILGFTFTVAAFHNLLASSLVGFLPLLFFVGVEIYLEFRK